MARNTIAACLLAALAVGCDRHADAPEHGHTWAPPGACRFVGNQGDRHYCGTTAIQLLANPQLYDGRLVSIRGWVLTSGNTPQVGIFLTSDAADTADFDTSLALEGSAVAQIVARAKRVPPYTPLYVEVAGRFHLSTPNERRFAGSRFGTLKEATEQW
jgi:hypothetical protein